MYHVVARANRGEFILDSFLMKEMMIDVLRRARKKYSFKLKHFCIMGNHIHLLIEPQGKTTISRIMQWILSVFALKFNRIFGYHGHVWYDRFKSRIIEGFRQFWKTFEYISKNPVKAKVCQCVSKYDYCGIKFIQENRFDLVDPPDITLRLMFPYLENKMLQN